MFESDDQTESIVMVGEIEGPAEEEAAEFIKDKVSKPVASHIAGSNCSKGKRMDMPEQLFLGGMGTAQDKFKALESAGVSVVTDLNLIGSKLTELHNPFFILSLTELRIVLIVIPIIIPTQIPLPHL